VSIPRRSEALQTSREASSKDVSLLLSATYRGVVGIVGVVGRRSSVVGHRCHDLTHLAVAAVFSRIAITRVSQ